MIRRLSTFVLTLVAVLALASSAEAGLFRRRCNGPTCRPAAPSPLAYRQALAPPAVAPSTCANGRCPIR